MEQNNQSNKPSSLDPRLKEIIRKPWVEFVRLESPVQCTVVARFFLNKLDATHEEFMHVVGINLQEYYGCYMECGTAFGPTGPIFPGPVRPVLRFKMSGRGRWIVHRLEVDGLYHESMMHAWIKTDLWEQIVGDEDYFENVFLKQQRVSKNVSKKTG